MADSSTQVIVQRTAESSDVKFSQSIQITTIRLNGSNYVNWSRSVLMYLRARRMAKYINDDPPVPVTEDWVAEDNLVMTWLVNSMESRFSDQILSCNTAKAMWTTLASILSQESNLSSIYELYMKFFNMKRGGRSVTDYFTEMRGVLQEINTFHPFTMNVEDIRKKENQIQVARFLDGLGHEYDAIRTQLLVNEDVTTLEQAFNRVL
ncbi:uncharacterized protein [Aristolochia californica]|uniref:uncharacterized protein n=1 Tax=Aristolochia californica TaxID=171875 RepID=UPI0035DCF99E